VTARRMPNGLLRPELADLLEGTRVAQELGLDPATIPHKALTAMGAAVADQRMANYRGPVYGPEGPPMTEELAQALDRIEWPPREHHVSKAQNMAPDQGRDPGQGSPSHTPVQDQGLDQGQRPTMYVRKPPKISGNQIEAPNDPGHDEQAARGRQQDLDRKREFDRKRYWARITRDYDEQEWT
jgi:hypothetical protein